MRMAARGRWASASASTCLSTSYRVVIIRTLHPASVQPPAAFHGHHAVAAVPGNGCERTARGEPAPRPQGVEIHHRKAMVRPEEVEGPLLREQNRRLHRDLPVQRKRLFVTLKEGLR